MKILEINTVAFGSSTGAYMRSVADACMRRGCEVAIAKGRRADAPGVRNIATGTRLTPLLHGAATRLFDMHGLVGARATRGFIKAAEAFGPDVIHLHNIHGYYLHYPTLFEWLRSYGAPVFWTLHDGWALTGHCAFPEGAGGLCPRLAHGCGKCPQLSQYPAALIDRSAANYRRKAEVFTSVPSLTLLPVSHWLDGLVARSPLAPLRREVVHIDIDIELYKPTGTVADKPRVLGVAANWEDRKGLDFFSKLRATLPDDVEIRIAGRPPRRRPEGLNFLGVLSREELIAEYSQASVFVNPTLAENLCLVNREALACGCPVASRDSGAATEGLSGPAVAAAASEAELIDAVHSFLNGKSPRAEARGLAESLFSGEPNMHRLLTLFGVPCGCGSL